MRRVAFKSGVRARDTVHLQELQVVVDHSDRGFLEKLSF